MAIPRFLLSELKALTIVVPQVVVNKLDTDLAIEDQKDPLWCWAAVGVAVARYYRDQETQCELAAKVKVATEGCCDDEGKPEACSDPHKMEEVLEKAGSGHLSNRNPPAILSEAIAAEYDAEKPLVCAVKGWQVNGEEVSSHVVIVRGLIEANGMALVKYLDPAGQIVDSLHIDSFSTKLDRLILTD